MHKFKISRALRRIFSASFIIVAIGASAQEVADNFYNERVQSVIDKIADVYTPPAKNIGDPEKYYWPKAMARFQKYGIEDAQSNQNIEELCTKGAFHFAIVGMTRLIYQFPDAPALSRNLSKILDKNLSAGLTVSEGTENHLSMERTSIYLLARKALELNPENSVARETESICRDWILKWSRRVYQYGVGEWNSSTYGLYNLMGWLNLYDYADDPEVRDAALAVVDYYAAEIALHYSWGAPGGSEMRGNKEADKNRTSSSYLAWLWFGEDANCPMSLEPAEYIQLMHPILSSYLPPRQIFELARKNDVAGDWYQNSKPSYLYEHHSFCQQDFYVSPNFTLGNLVSAYGGYTGASYAIIPWRLVVKRPGECPYEIGGGGRYRDTWNGQSRTPFTQTVQYRNCLISMTKLPENHNEHYEVVKSIIEQWKKDWDADYRKRHEPKDNVVNMVDGTKRAPIAYLNLPGTLKYETFDKNIIVDAGEVYIVVSSLHDPTISTRAESGRITLIDESEVGQLASYALEVVEKKDVADYNAFKRKVMQQSLTLSNDTTVVYKTLDGNMMQATFNGYGTCIEPLFDWGYGATEPMCMLASPPLRQPEWPTGDGFGKVPTLLVNGEGIDYASSRPVYSGPRYTLDESVLTVEGSDNTVFKVDFSGDKPVREFMEAGIDKNLIPDSENFVWNYQDGHLTVKALDDDTHICSIIDIDGRLIWQKTFNKSIDADINTSGSKIYVIKIDNNNFKIIQR